MKILKHGDTIDKYECKCPKCGCEWLCDEDEINLTVEYDNSSQWSTEPIFVKMCSCPECGEEEVEAKERLIK